MVHLTAAEHTDASPTAVQLTLSSAEAEQLRIVLPWLLRALAERPMTPASQRERRRHASAVLERLLTALSGQVPHVEVDRPSQ